MEIIIPSKNIYGEIQNPKVRDNVIERIEVGAVEVVPNNDYETPVHNETVGNLSLKTQETTNEDLQETWIINTGAYLFTGACAYAGYNSQKYHEQKVYIPKLKNNSFINKLLLGTDNDNNQNIKTTFIGTKNEGITSGTWYGNFETSGIVNELIVTKGTIDYSKPTVIKPSERYDIPKEISYTYQSENRGNPTATTKLIDIGNLSTVSFNEEVINNIEYYTLQLKILCGIRIVYMGGYDNGMQGTITNCPFVMSGTYEEYIPTEIEITIYGNTIGIDLKDKTVYINGETQKKVHSVDGNELMQTSNYIEQNGTKINAIDKMYGDTQKAYENGKETATIRCSISDYYYKNDEIAVSIRKDKIVFDHTDRNFIKIGTGEKTIYAYLLEPILYDLYVTIKYGNTTNVWSYEEVVIRAGETVSNPISVPFNPAYKEVQETYAIVPMLFSIGQKVIPMVYGADGQDRPMSYYKNGQAKVFQVEGVRPYYDGAVWQELSLQEIQEEGGSPEEPEQPDEPTEPDFNFIGEMSVLGSEGEIITNNVFDENATIVDGDLVWDSLAIRMYNVDDGMALDLFDIESSYYENSLNWTYRLKISNVENDLYIYYNGTNYIHRSWWKDCAPITIDFYIENGVGVIKATDRDGYEAIATGVDFNADIIISKK